MGAAEPQLDGDLVLGGDLTVLRSAPTQDSLRANVSRSAVFTLPAEPALRRRRPDVSFIRRLPV